MSARPLMEQRDGGDYIDTRLHRCAPLPPLDDADEVVEREYRAKARNWAICDAAVSVILVVVLALLIGGRL